MVLLTMTAAIVEALEKLQSYPDGSAARIAPEDHSSTEPQLAEPTVGKPITHGQVIDIHRQLKSQGHQPYHLEALLRGSNVYVPPPPPRLEPTPEYKALMARLRREEEARAYERMINPPPPAETFSQRFPAASAAHAFSSTAAFEAAATKVEDDELTYSDIDRQLALILNVLVSVVACAAAIWMAAKWWSTPARLALSMSGSILVGVAEVVVYMGYIRRVGEAKGKENAVTEVKEIVKTWVVGGDTDGDGKREKQAEGTVVATVEKEDPKSVRERKRRKESTLKNPK